MRVKQVYLFMKSFKLQFFFYRYKIDVYTLTLRKKPLSLTIFTTTIKELLLILNKNLKHELDAIIKLIRFKYR